MRFGYKGGRLSPLVIMSSGAKACRFFCLRGSMAKTKTKIESAPTNGQVLADGIAVHCAHDEIVDADSLIPNPRNPNSHPGEQIRLLAKIIKHQGWRAPITVSNRSGFIVRGHGRLMAAKVLGAKQCPIDRQDYECEADEWADLIADNRLSELSETDNPKLKDLLETLDVGAMDMELTAWTEQAMADLMSQFHVPKFEPTSEEEQPRLDLKTPVKCPECGHEFVPI